MRGFSLVELSIVLVILGLLTGGILSGQSLIRAAEIRSVTTEHQRYLAAVHSFRDRYHALPGDLRNATRFWGAADGTTGLTAGCVYIKSTGTETCNGNGDGLLYGLSGEQYRMWQHLANAGLVEGTYTGAPQNTMSAHNRYAAAGINIPASKLSNAAWYAENGGVHDGSGWAWPGNHAPNVFIYGAVEATDITEVPILRPQEAWNIDIKLDDGKPALGKIVTSRTSTNCNNTNVTADAAIAEYNLLSASIACHLIFIAAF